MSKAFRTGLGHNRRSVSTVSDCVTEKGLVNGRHGWESCDKWAGYLDDIKKKSAECCTPEGS